MDYEQRAMQQEAAKMQELTEFLLYQCVKDDPPPLAEWGMDYARWGLEPPDESDPVNFKLRWIEDIFCPGPDCMAKLLGQLYRLVGLMGKDLASEFEAFFRVTLERLLPR